MTHITPLIWVTSLLKPDMCKAIQWLCQPIQSGYIQSHTFSKCPLCSVAQAPAARHYLPVNPPFLEGKFAWRQLVFKRYEPAAYLCAVLTMSAVWFLLRTALCRAVMPSFVLKSRCAPPLFSTLMSSAQPSSWAASVRGHSVSTRKQKNVISADILLSKHLLIWIVTFYGKIICGYTALHLDNCLGRWDCHPPVCFQLVLNQPILMLTSLRSSSATLQVTQHWNLLYGWSNICIYMRRLAKRIIQLYPACTRLISEIHTWSFEMKTEGEKRQIKDEKEKTIVNNMSTQAWEG